jgi:hypothetical protein
MEFIGVDGLLLLVLAFNVLARWSGCTIYYLVVGDASQKVSDSLA